MSKSKRSYIKVAMHAIHSLIQVSPCNWMNNDANLRPASDTSNLTWLQPQGNRDHTRPPVVTVMGHVDHGKTTLLDALRKSSVAASEAGGITQRIGAFTVPLPGSGSVITFLDTPGHAAFSAMRARGAALTDIAVLVVAADDGVKPQTEEALHHAQAAGCPLVVALTKCDVPGANPDRVKQQLLSLGLELDEIGGDVQVVEVAAPQARGLQQLEEALLFQAELMDLETSATGPPTGTVVEARMDKGHGPVATLIAKQGTLKVGQHLVLGMQYGKLRAIMNDAGRNLKEALPGQPVEVTGLRGMPMAGDSFIAETSEESARQVCEARRLTNADNVSKAQQGPEVVDPTAESVGTSPPLLTCLIKADTQGLAEAITATVEALGSPTVTVKAHNAGPGAVSISDINMAAATGAKLLAFNVSSSSAVRLYAKQHKVHVQQCNIIYSMVQEVQKWIAELAPCSEEEVVLGKALVLQTFPVRGQQTLIAGCRIELGSMSMGKTFRVLRAGDALWEGSAVSLKRAKLSVQQVGKGAECGIVLDGFSKFQTGDVLQCFTTQLVAQQPEFMSSA